jgi:hypothetical protein
MKWLPLVVVALILSPVNSVAEEELSQGKIYSYYAEIAMSGEPYAQLALGEAFYTGEGFGRDLVQAYAWFSVSSEQGVEEAEEFLKKLETELDAPSLLEAKSLASDYMSRFTIDASQ